jgi:DNA-binding NarL/FixJ family response regulator
MCVPVPVSVTILIAHELPLVREGIAALCTMRPGFHAAYQCADGEEALAAIRLRRPDVALLDSSLPVLSPLDLIRTLRSEDTPCRLVLMTTNANRYIAPEALRLGASGVILKSDPARGLLEAIQTVTDGRVYLAASLAVGCLSTPETNGGNGLERLSPREHQVFSMLVEGVRAKEIAARLELSAKTVDTYRSSLMRKLDIHDVAGLVRFAIQKRLIAV